MLAPVFMKYLDTNQEELIKGDIINLHETVNGQNSVNSK